MKSGQELRIWGNSRIQKIGVPSEKMEKAGVKVRNSKYKAFVFKRLLSEWEPE
jgi:hypothetical protein